MSDAGAEIEKATDRTRRLVNLIALFLDAKAPKTFEEIRDEMQGAYEGAHDTAIKKFERDKADLRELGVPITHPKVVDQDGEEGAEEDANSYVVVRSAAYLPPIRFSKEELEVLVLAGSAFATQESFPYRGPLNVALSKLRLADPKTSEAGASSTSELAREGGLLVHHPVVAGGAGLRELLAVLQGALTARKTVTFTYQAQQRGDVTSRRVNPYGLFCKRGAWFLVGWSHERSALRTFFVHRMRDLAVNEIKPKKPDFDVPEDFELRKHVELPTWQWSTGQAPANVEVDVAADLAFRASRDLGSDGTPVAGGGWSRFQVEVTNLDGLIEWALGMGGKARIAGPPEARKRARAALQAVLDRNTPGARRSA